MKENLAHKPHSEVNKPQFVRNGLRVVAGTLLGLTLAVDTVSQKDNCNGPVKWQGNWHENGKRDSIAVCTNEEGRIEVVGRDSPVRILPEGVKEEWVLSGRDGLIYWLTEDEDNFDRIYEMDLKEGKTEMIYEFYRTSGYGY